VFTGEIVPVTGGAGRVQLAPFETKLYKLQTR
jgi:hypothetical protein